MIQITREEKDYLSKAIPDLTFAVVNKTKKAKRKKVYVEESGKVLYFLAKHRRTKQQNGGDSYKL